MASKNPVALRINQAFNFLNSLMPFSVDTKRPSAWNEYGYPQNPDFATFYSMFKRNGLGNAGVVAHVEKTWSTYPCIRETLEEHNETGWEKSLADMFERTGFWRALEGADRRQRVGKYGGVLLLFADGQQLKEPVGQMGAGLNSLSRLVPFYESQLKPTEWVTDQTDPDYGLPKMYLFQESAIGDRDRNDPARSVEVHPSRVHIWAEGADDGSIYGTPALEAGLNALITMEKIVGAGGEGFWKTARAAMMLNVDKEQDIRELAESLGTDDVSEVADKMEELIADFTSGFDKSLLTKGIEAKNQSINLPSPEHYFAIALQEFSASVRAPAKILIGNQTGERASEEDNDEWNATITSRRTRFAVPQIKSLIKYLMAIGVVKEKEFEVDWDDLMAPSFSEKLDNAKKMSETNKNMLGSGEPVVFTSDEMREAADYSPHEDDIPEGEDLPEDDLEEEDEQEQVEEEEAEDA